MDSATDKSSWDKLFTGTVAVVGLVGSIVGISVGVLPILQGRHPVTGLWTLTTQTENSTEDSFKGMELTYTVNFTSDGGHITGTGEKLGQKLAGQSYMPYEPKARTPINIRGSFGFSGDSLDAVFTEAGEKRPTSGHLALKWDRKSKSWLGTFDSEAATSTGDASLSLSSE